ncbi:hypothetical protein QJS04_geneDACA020565 [Acorus gramineus]|uniref:Uncharacterized protein n=1 Tax=Acorus gramineus TaxID=55184 RepID=A0AAV9A0S2_ACOGR|nr:hypothetical protein QJS04_geneDACA020565 [Acorus gramineus]
MDSVSDRTSSKHHQPTSNFDLTSPKKHQPTSANREKQPQPQPPPAIPKPRPDDLSWMPPLGVAFVACNSIIAIYRSRDDIPTVAFIIAANIALALLFLSIRSHEKAPAESKRKHKIWIWSMATLLNVGFAWKVTMILPLWMSLILWALVAVSTVGTFYLYFLFAHGKN